LFAERDAGLNGLCVHEPFEEGGIEEAKGLRLLGHGITDGSHRRHGKPHGLNKSLVGFNAGDSSQRRR
jgi:hypothetical protein